MIIKENYKTIMLKNSKFIYSKSDKVGSLVLL